MALENVLVYSFVTGDDTYPHTGTFTIAVAGQVTIDDSNGSDDTLFGDLTHTGGADVPDQDVSASTVAGVNAGDTIDLRYKYTFTGSDGSTGTVYFIATNGAANYGPLMVSDTPLDPSVTYTFGAFNTDGAVPYDTLVPCFGRGTRIKTEQGYIAVEYLTIDHSVLTMDQGYQPINWIGSRVVCATDKLAPIVIEAGVLGNTRTLRVSPCHRMLITGAKAQLLFGESEVLVAAKHLVGWDGIYVERTKTVEYFHIMFESHQIIMAEGAMTESFFPGDACMNSMAIEAKEEIFTIFPELRISLIGYGGLVRRSLKAYEAQLLAA